MAFFRIQHRVETESFDDGCGAFGRVGLVKGSGQPS